MYLLNFRKQSNQVELDWFFAHLDADKTRIRSVTKSALSQARKQLSHHAFIELNDGLIDQVYGGAYYAQWRGFRLCAIDGTSVRLPAEADIVDAFGVQHGRAGQADCAMATGSVFYDVLNHLVIDASLHPFHTPERECAVQHLERSLANDLILYDRGYPAFWLYAWHRQHQRAFCMRATTQRSKQIQDFIASGKQQARVRFTPNHPSRETCERKGLSTEPVMLRLIRVDLPNEVEVLVTNLLDEEAFEAAAFKALYHLRWGVEEQYKHLKQWVEIENFSGKSAQSVEQDFYARIVASNLTALMRLMAQKQLEKRTAKRKHAYQVNGAYALSQMKHRLVALIHRAQGNIMPLITQIVQAISRCCEAVRPNRKYPRKLKNIKNKLHFPAYKSAL